MRKPMFFCLLPLLLTACQTPPAPVSSPVPVAAANGDPDWFTHFGDDGSYSVAFPKAPEQVGKGPQSTVLACPLDKLGSNLSLIRMPLPPGLTGASVRSHPEKLFGQAVQLVKATETRVQNREALSIEILAGPNRVWVTMVFAPPRLYQLVALQAPASPRDYAPERRKFFDSFQLSGPKPEARK